jgi:hypothetical protein
MPASRIDHRKPPTDLRLFYLQRAPPAIPGVYNVQTYFPSLEQLFPSLQARPQPNPTLAATELVTTIGEDGVATVENLITHETRQTPIWMRQVHLVQPLDVVDGSFVLPHDGALPAPRAPWQAALRKLNDPYNEAYTDAICACMASRLVETKRSPHFCRFYGTVAGRVPEYVYNVTEDLEEIEDEDWFKEGMRTGTFKVVAVDPWDPTVTAELTQPWGTGKPWGTGIPAKGCVTDAYESEEESTDESTDESTSSDESRGNSTPSATSECDDECEPVEEDDIPITGEATVHGRRIRLNRMSGSASGDDTSTSSSMVSDDLEYRMLIKDFPVQISILERCDGTMDKLMEDELSNATTQDMADTKEQRWTSWLFQVVAALSTAQQAFDFIHNDLHTNNVMWTGTGETHLYYHVRGAAGGDRYYRVPTYGRLMKIIDFGRATFRPSAAATNNRLWIPDAYAPGGDAAGQYNCGPYFQQGEPKVQPNKSFDLCRLAVAILDTLWPEVPEVAQPRRVLTRESGRVTAETISPLWNLLWLWLTDRHGKNLLLDPDGNERYPTFDLYCAIAADAKNAVPAAQLTLPIFDNAFRCKRADIPDDAPVWILHARSA